MRKGFTLLETIFAVAVFSLVMGMTLSSWLLFMYKSNRVSTQASLDMDARKVIERFRHELRNTARETVIFYPENQEPYQAVGFALAGSGTNGPVEMSEGGTNILWRESVVYHVWNHSPHQMRRTVFANRNPNALYADRYGQIAAVVAAGNGASACLAGENASTIVMFENLFTGKLWHASAQFDGYAPAANTRERVTFGSLPLGPGEHTVSFTVKGKNNAATSRALRLDRILASVSGWPQEAEWRTTSGAAAAPYHVGQNKAGAAYGLAATAAGIGDTLHVKVRNDAIEEYEFIGEGRNVAFSNTVVRFDAVSPPSGFAEGTYAARIDGQFGTEKNWTCAEQTGHYRNDYFRPLTNCVIRIPVMADPNRSAASGEPVLYGLKKDGYGPVFRLYKSLYNGGLQVLDPSFAVVALQDVPADYNSNLLPKLDPEAQISLEFWQNGAKKTDWAACAKQSFLELRPAELIRIPMGSTLMLQFRTTVTAPDDSFTRFDVVRYDKPGVRIPGCWVIPAGGTNLLGVFNWQGIAGLELKPFVPTLEFAAVNYADGGEYVSHPYDTKSAAGAAKTFAWEADVPAGADLAMFARSGDTLTDDGFVIADAPSWENVAEASSGGGFSGNTGRYVQFRATFLAQPASQYPGGGGLGSAGPYRSDTPRIRWARFTWDGEEKYVDVTAELLKSPDCGIFEVKVDNKPLVRGVTMEIEIFKDVKAMSGSKQERLKSAMTAEVEPRNSGK
ncbi:MAG: type II secretion system protein [Kiritimatiellia bacterium]|jgi:prepilin-type N-terminal cleavage/methylation domain-containing protein|nr:type II secretion system protein [Kiritimatiellia bacterium]